MASLGQLYKRLGWPCVVIDIGRPTDAPDEHGVPGQHRSAPRGDGDEAGEDPIAQRAWWYMVGRTWLMVLEPYVGQGRC